MFQRTSPCMNNGILMTRPNMCVSLQLQSCSIPTMSSEERGHGEPDEVDLKSHLFMGRDNMVQINLDKFHHHQNAGLSIFRKNESIWYDSYLYRVCPCSRQSGLLAWRWTQILTLALIIESKVYKLSTLTKFKIL